MKKAQENDLMIVKEINPTFQSGLNLPTILKFPVFIKSPT